MPDATATTTISAARKRQPAAEVTPLYATIDDACRLSGLGRTSVYALVQRREVVTAKVGRKRLIQVASLVAFLRSAEETSK